MAVGAVTRALGQCALEQKVPLTRDEAATKIQSVYRGHLSRVETVKKLGKILSGEVGRYKQEHFEKLNQESSLCKELGFDLLVPLKVRRYNNFMIITNPPMSDHDIKEYMGFYIEHKEAFTEAVKQLAGFFCHQAARGRVTTGLIGPERGEVYSPVSKADLPLTWHLPLYLEGGKGKIGLDRLYVDFPRNYKKRSLQCHQEVCKDLIHFFPYHFEEIMSVVKAIDPDIEQYRELLAQTRDEVLKNFKGIYENHLAFVQSKGITVQNPLELVQVTPGRAEALKQAVVLAIRNAYETDKWTGCLGSDLDHDIQVVEKAFPKILDTTTKFLSNSLKKRFEHEYERKGMSSNSQLLACRSLFSHAVEVYSNWTKDVLAELVAMGLEVKEGLDVKKGWFAQEVIFEAFFKEMRGHEIAYCSFSWGMYGQQTIFC